MLYKWHWLTFFLYVLIAIFFLMTLKKTQFYKMRAVTGNKIYINKIFVFNLIAYSILILLPMLRNIDLYPTYEISMETGIRTIDPQAYIWQIESGFNPGFNLKEMITFKQTEPLMYSIAHLILKIGGGFQEIWFVLFSMIIICYLYFFYYTAPRYLNYGLLFPFIALFLYSMGGIRSGLSFAFFYAAVACRKQNKNFLTIICLGIGFCFHYLIIFGALGLIFDIIFKKFSHKKYVIVLMLITIILTVHISKSIMSAIIANTKYNFYLNSGPITIIGQIPVIVLIILCIVDYNNLINEFPENRLFLNLVIFSGLCLPIVINFGVYRLGMYFLIMRLYAWQMLIKIYERRFKVYNKIIMIKVINKKYSIYNLIGSFISFLWFTKMIYDIKGNGIMPLFNMYI